MGELKPCPFCGGKDDKCLVITSNGEENYWVMCNDCGAEGPTANEHKAIEVWNKRA